MVVKLCVFSMLFARVAELKCKDPWSYIRRTLSTLQATEFHTPQNQFSQRNEPTSELVKILKSPDIPMPKTVLDIKTAPSET